MTKSQELFFKAGVYQERAKSCLELRKYYNNYFWDEYTEESKKWKAKSERFLKRAEEEAKKEMSNEKN